MTEDKDYGRSAVLGAMLSVLSLAEEDLGTIEMLSLIDLDDGGIKIMLNLDGSKEAADDMLRKLTEILDYGEDINVYVTLDRNSRYVVAMESRSSDNRMVATRVNQRVRSIVRERNGMGG